MGLLKVVAEQDRKLKDSELRELARDQTINDLRKKTRLLQQSVRRKGKALEASKQELETCKSRKKTAADSIDNQLLDFLLSAAEGHGCGAIVFSRDLVVKGLMQIVQPVFSNKKLWKSTDDLGFTVELALSKVTDDGGTWKWYRCVLTASKLCFACLPIPFH